jgi:hypothetical protein
LSFEFRFPPPQLDRFHLEEAGNAGWFFSRRFFVYGSAERESAWLPRSIEERFLHFAARSEDVTKLQESDSFVSKLIVSVSVLAEQQKSHSLSE